MPAAAVIPAPIAYIKVVAVKKLVVEYRISFIMASVILVSWFSVYKPFCSFTSAAWRVDNLP